MAPAWTEIAVIAPVEWLELVAETLALGPCSSVAFGRPSLATPEPPAGLEWVRAYVIESEDTPALRAEIEAALAALGELTGASELAGLSVRFRRLPPEDYATSWRKSWKPMRVADFAIVPRDWKGILRPGDRRLVLEPGGAFGTGRHPTTRGCLRAISRLVRPGERVLDAGCGNGVLAVAAALCGASHALGFDIDPSAIPYADELAEWNGVRARCEFRAGTFECLREDERGFDGVLANIFADLIQAHVADMAARLRPGGWFAFSGCLDKKRYPTVAAIEEAGLVIDTLHTRGLWDTFVGHRP
jgi:ribosomal protein L11 methyltransferase